MSTTIETTSGPVSVTAATARSAARRTAARPAASSERRNGAWWAMPSRHDASWAGVARPVGTAVVFTRTRVNPAAAACPASTSGSLARDPGARAAYQAGG